MLGEELGQEIGQMTGTRVLAPKDGMPVVETSFQATGTILGEHSTDMGTYRAIARPDGSMYGEGNGIMMMGESGAMVLWRGTGIGHFTGQGMGVQWRGTLYMSTASEKFSRLNGVPAVFEFETDDSGKTEATIWEWK